MFVLAGCSESDLPEPYGNEQGALLHDYNVVNPSDLQLDEIDEYDVSGRSWKDFNSVPEVTGNSEIDNDETIALISYHSDKDKFKTTYTNGGNIVNGPYGWVSLNDQVVSNVLNEEDPSADPPALSGLASASTSVNQTLRQAYAAYYSCSSSVKRRISDKIGFSRINTGNSSQGSLFAGANITDAYAFPTDRIALDVLAFEDGMVGSVSAKLAGKKNTILLQSKELLSIDQVMSYAENVSGYVFIAVDWYKCKNCLGGWSDKPTRWAVLYNEAAKDKANKIYNGLNGVFESNNIWGANDGKFMKVEGTQYFYEPEFALQSSKPVILVILDAGVQTYKTMKTPTINNSIAEAIASAF